MNDALDDILADSDDESEEQAVIDKVLDEIGIEISGKVNIFVILKDQIKSCFIYIITRGLFRMNLLYFSSWPMLLLLMLEQLGINPKQKQQTKTRK